MDRGLVSRGIAIPVVPVCSSACRGMAAPGPLSRSVCSPSFRLSDVSILDIGHTVYYSLRPMVTGTTVYPLMICYSVFDVCCGNRAMSSSPPRPSPVSSNLSPCAVYTLYRSHPSSIISSDVPRNQYPPVRFLNKRASYI